MVNPHDFVVKQGGLVTYYDPCKAATSHVHHHSLPHPLPFYTQVSHSFVILSDYLKSSPEETHYEILTQQTLTSYISAETAPDNASISVLLLLLWYEIFLVWVGY